MTRSIATIADLRALVGVELGPSAPLTIDQDRINAFADATGDRQWIHIDPERAATGPYGATIAHGYLTLSLIPAFGRELLDFVVGGARINYGVDKVRFPAPVRVGSRLRATATVTNVVESVAGVMVSVRYVVAIDGETKPACVADTLVLVVS